MPAESKTPPKVEPVRCSDPGRSGDGGWDCSACGRHFGKPKQVRDHIKAMLVNKDRAHGY